MMLTGGSPTMHPALVNELETQIKELIKKLDNNVTNSNEYYDDDLPF